MMRQTRGLGSLATVSGIASLCLPIQAFEARDLLAFSAGPVVIRPHLNLAEEYNDNIFYGNDKAVGSRVRPVESDWITSINPGAQFRLGRPDGDNVVTLNYDFTQMFYLDNPQIDTAWMHNVALSGTVRGERLTSVTSGRFGWMDTIYGGYSAFEQGSTNTVAATVEQLTYSASQNFEYSLTRKTTLTAGGSVSAYEFTDRPDLYNSSNWRVSGGARFNPTEKLGFTTELYYGQQASDPNSDLTYLNGVPVWPKPPHMEMLGGTVGATGRFTQRLSGTVRAGYQQNFQSSSIYYPDTGDFGAPIVNAALDWKLNERTSANVGYYRSTSMSVQNGSAYVTDAFSARFQQIFGPSAHPWLFRLGGRYGLNAYETGPSKNLDTEYFSIDSSLYYQFRIWLRAGLSYQFQKSFGSNQSTIDYEVNQVTFTIAIGY